ncbi:MAG: flagellar biosynthetic protein FliO [Hyphomicrobiaceae bacterium]
MWDVLSWLFFIVFIAGLIVVGGLLIRGYMTGGTPGAGLTGTLFAPKPDKRLEVVDQANIDGRRRLVLIRRDKVEHLIMTGGPVDVVIETGIGEARRGEADEPGSATIVRTPRRFGQAVGEG